MSNNPATLLKMKEESYGIELSLMLNKILINKNYIKQQQNEDEQLVQGIDEEIKKTISRDKNAKMILKVIRQKFLTYQFRKMQQAFKIWQRKTPLVSKTAKYLDITSNSQIKCEQERIENLKAVVEEKKEELEELKKENEILEEQGKQAFKQKQEELEQKLAKLACNTLKEVINHRGLRVNFYLIKSFVEFKKKKAIIMQNLPKPRRKQWWENLMEKEYDHFYEKAELQMKKAPKSYQGLYETIIEHRLIKQIITIQRFFRKKKMMAWLVEHNLENGRIIEQGQRNQNAKRLVKVDVSFLDSRGKERGELEICSIY